MVDARPCEYLVSYGKSGAFGRFAPATALGCLRGDTVVVQSQRGLELGVVLCPATPRQARLLGKACVGVLLRQATPQDTAAAGRLDALGQLLFADGCRLAAELGIAVGVLDVEVLLDGRHAVVQHLSPDSLDPTPFAETLSRRHDVTVLLENLATPLGEPVVDEAAGGCGKPGCGRASGSGCTSCGTGGCSSCGAGKVAMTAYFAHLRSKMEAKHRVPLV
jgi:hypothetical protein